ncbi:MAG: hypothetical protein IT378_26845 [Sandaracinaceae bacterium]|nr:hypothetical protein [Sandaracinaceae bacterium]
MRSAVVVGLGQMGGTFAHGLLRSGIAVVPVTRALPLERVAAEVDPELCLVAVGEGALPGVLSALPSAWRARVALLQNELFPDVWRAHGIADPTVAVVWFEKKATTAVRVILPTPIAGPHAAILGGALDELAIPNRVVTQEELLDELVLKDLYILTANVAGLEVGGTVGRLWTDHHALAVRVAGDVLALSSWRTGVAPAREALFARLGDAFLADPDHACTGRTARERLERARARARAAGLAVPELDRIASMIS